MTSQGFTILEVLIAITVLTIGLIGALTLLTFSLSSYEESSNKVVAVNLAQEGVEVVRSFRDRGELEWGVEITRGWLKYNYNWDQLKSYDEMAAFLGFPDFRSTNSCDDAWLNVYGLCVYSRTGEYSVACDISSGAWIGRQIRITYPGSCGGCAKIESIVCWKNKKGKYRHTITETHLYDWK
jgi:prepilin-type N-terminal cleavage/methylation domain-containing protein